MIYTLPLIFPLYFNEFLYYSQSLPFWSDFLYRICYFYLSKNDSLRYNDIILNQS